jgi:hypothetical protein
VTKSEYLGLFCNGILGLFLVVYMMFYTPLPAKAYRGDCLEYREAKQVGLFISSVECIKWQK